MTITRKATVSCGSYEVEGYLVRDEFFAFTFEQAMKVSEEQKRLVDKYDNGTPESFALIEYDGDENGFSEVYYDGEYAFYEAIDVDGLTLYAIGDEWEWEEVA